MMRHVRPRDAAIASVLASNTPSHAFTHSYTLRWWLLLVDDAPAAVLSMTCGPAAFYPSDFSIMYKAEDNTQTLTCPGDSHVIQSFKTQHR